LADVLDLREKTPEARDAWLAVMWDGYREALLTAGNSPEEADQNIAGNRAALFSDGEPVAGQFFLDVLDGEAIVGSLWLARRGDETSTVWWVYDVEIEQAHRGRGLGRGAMEAAEVFVKARGATRLGLNVFGPNTVARHLYESMAYKTMSVQMYKDFD